MAEQATDTAERILALFEADRVSIQSALGKSAISALQVHDYVRRHAFVSSSLAVNATGLSMPTVLAALSRLQNLGIVRETTGQARNRIYVYDRYLTILNAGVARDVQTA